MKHTPTEFRGASMSTLVVARTVKEGKEFTQDNGIPLRNIWTPRTEPSHRGRFYDDMLILDSFEILPEYAHDIAPSFKPCETKRQKECYLWLAHKASGVRGNA